MRAIAFLFLLATGCAAARDDDFFRDSPRHGQGQTRPGTPPPAPPPPSAHVVGSAEPPPRPRKAYNPSEHAASLQDDIQCARATGQLENEGRAEDAWALLRVCLDTGKWRDLKRLLTQPPWSTNLAKLPEQERMELIGRLLSNRGSLLETDVPLCQRHKVELHELSEVFGDRPISGKKWLVFVASVVDDDTDKKNRRTLELAELVRGNPTGATITGIVGGGAVFAEESEVILALARLESAERTTSSGYPHARVRIVAVYKPGSSTFEVAP